MFAHVPVIPKHTHRYVGWDFWKFSQDVVEGPGWKGELLERCLSRSILPLQEAQQPSALYRALELIEQLRETPSSPTEPPTSTVLLDTRSSSEADKGIYHLQASCKV